MFKKRIFIFALLVFIVLPFFFWPKPAAAIAFLGFGGRILNTIPCANGLLLTIGPPRPGLYMWMWGTLTFAWYQLRPPAWALGTFFPGGACICPYGACPGVIPALGTIIMIGTSAF